MDINNGELYRGNSEALAELMQKAEVVPVTERQYQTMQPMARSGRKGWMRNQPCACGSGKKFKRCHWYKPEELSQS